MKTFVLAISAMLLFSLSGYSQNQTAPDNGVKKASSTVAKAGTLSDKEIEELLSESTDEKTGQKIVFNAFFGTAKPKSAYEKKKYEKSGTIPIRITCTLSDVKQVNGKNMSKLLRGTARMYVMDSDGKIVMTESASLDKMCPS
ncbi:MAG: hypothetical protein PHR77_06580 [Kiritimatiellae bacterium]|nr:hypothetical protein [Kiritimatiellia bacterium]MDD5520943.1 hypothetical protein [Kiritimatiellia bacterium]